MTAVCRKLPAIVQPQMTALVRLLPYIFSPETTTSPVPFAADTDPTETLMLFPNYSHSGHFGRLHALVVKRDFDFHLIIVPQIPWLLLIAQIPLHHSH
jgi:hypothetical protein